MKRQFWHCDVFMSKTGEKNRESLLSIEKGLDGEKLLVYGRSEGWKNKRTLGKKRLCL